MTIAAAVLAAAGCGAEEPKSAASPADYERALADAPPPLDRLYSRPNELLSGGPEAFERTLRGLRGHPVVVNKWASWCGPCRFEFPFFQKQVKKRGKEIAFLAVDSEDARDEAARVPGGVPGPVSQLLRPQERHRRAPGLRAELPHHDVL